MEDLGEPELPTGLGGDEASSLTENDAEDAAGFTLPFDLTGFVDGRIGHRTQDDPKTQGFSLGEIRAQIEAEKNWSRGRARVTFDLLYDEVATKHDVNLETGRGWFDLREAFIAVNAASFLDLKVGRQILTWGTGDLIFINDLFPKDFVSFFVGRDMEYLKAPSDSAKASVFMRYLNVDFVYTPRFDADRYIEGRRISFYSALAGGLVGRDAIVRVERPDRWFRDDEIAVRLYRNVGAFELAAYGYRGYWKSPAGLDPANGEATFPRLTVGGASIRGPLAGGIANAELGYYWSEDDTSGSDSTINNSELRLLVGYERELVRDLSVGAQYYLERMVHHSDYRRSLPAGVQERDENRHILTFRVTQRLRQQNLMLGLFAYWSPSDRDGYLRPNIQYKIDDHWQVEAGGNVFFGDRKDTFFGQFDRNTNAYVSARYGF